MRKPDQVILLSNAQHHHVPFEWWEITEGRRRAAGYRWGWWIHRLPMSEQAILAVSKSQERPHQYDDGELLFIRFIGDTAEGGVPVGEIIDE